MDGLRIAKRSMSSEERAALEAALRASQVVEKGSRIAMLVLGGLFNVGVVFAVGTVLVSLGLQPLSAWGLAAAFAALDLVLFDQVARRKVAHRLSRGEGFRDQLRQDLEAHEVEVWRVEVRGVVAVGRIDEHVSSHLLEVGDGKLLYVDGDFVRDEIEAGRFPSSRFELVLGPASRATVAMRCEGSSLKPLRTRAFFDEREEHVPEHLEILDARLEALDHDLKRLRRAEKRAA